MKIKLFTVPNIITLGNLLCGCLSIVASLVVGDYTLALIFIVASAVCDFFDGLVARLLHQQSELGVQLDSLADDISFGLAPAIVMFDIYRSTTSYYALEQTIMEPLGYVVFIIAAFSALRLAKFNIDDYTIVAVKSYSDIAAEFGTDPLDPITYDGSMYWINGDAVLVAPKSENAEGEEDSEDSEDHEEQNHDDVISLKLNIILTISK